MLQRTSVTSPARRFRRLNVWIVSRLLRPRYAMTSMFVGIGVFYVLGLLILIGMKHGQMLFMDSTEAYAWGQQFLGGYGRHPPLTGWIARVWYAVFPAANWSSYALSRLMTCISLVPIYFMARRVAGVRRAVLIVLAMMVYPLFIGAKSDRFNNYQVLLALLPWTVWLFLRAYEKPSVRGGVALGLAAAAATLTIYSAVIGLAGIALAALLHPDRRRFFTAPAPYAAGMVYVAAVAPHVAWLVSHHFSSAHWALDFVGSSEDRSNVLDYLGHHLALLCFSLAFLALALWPWRRRAEQDNGRRADDRMLLIIVAAALVAGPVVLAVLFSVKLKLDWGNPFFFLVPLAVVSLLPTLAVTRRAIVKAAWMTAVFMLLLMAGAPVYAWVHFSMRPDDGPYTPYAEAAAKVTQLWRRRFDSPLPIVVSGFELAAPVVFYSLDHPKMFADFDPAYSPWIDYPTELYAKGFVGICEEADRRCRDYISSLNPAAESVEIEVEQRLYGAATPPLKLHLEFTGPRQRAP